MYHIEPQGEKGELITAPKVGVGTDKKGNKKGCFRLKSALGNPLPLLKVVLSNGGTEHFEVRWSNHSEQRGQNPGKFKLVHVSKQPVFLFEEENGRKVKDQYGNPRIDFVAMGMEFDSFPIYEDENDKRPKVIGWNFGERQNYARHAVEYWESETSEDAYQKLSQRFGAELAMQIMLLFIQHELFASFVAELAAA